ncbi:MAG: hypothetical protein WA416_12725 [Candidatus Sulfotelmatobacter sp.]
MPKTGQPWVRSVPLAATIFIRPNTDLALEMLTEAIRTGSQPAESKLIAPESVPTILELAARAAKIQAQSKQSSAGV